MKRFIALITVLLCAALLGGCVSALQLVPAAATYVSTKAGTWHQSSAPSSKPDAKTSDVKATETPEALKSDAAAKTSDTVTADNPEALKQKLAAAKKIPKEDPNR